MNIEELRDYCLSKNGVTEETPFDRHGNVLVFKVMGKIFVATDIEAYESIALKHDAEEIVSLKERYSFIQDPAYFSKKHWIKLCLNEMEVEAKLISELIDRSYVLVCEGLTKVQKEHLQRFQK